jgi:hypothetical protein
MESELIAAIGAYLGVRGTTFLDDALKPVATEVGNDFLARYRSWKARNVADVVDLAAQIIQDSGKVQVHVPGRILFPTLDYCAVEEEPEMQRRWAALLAHAATSSEPGKTLPAYAELLRQLTPIHARILHWMFIQEHEVVSNWFSSWPDFERGTIEAEFDLTPSDYALVVTDLVRLQIVEPRRTISSTEDSLDGEELLKWVVLQLNDREKYKTVAFTSLGIRFMEACTPPASLAKL